MFSIPSAAFKTSLQIDRGGKRDPKQYVPYIYVTLWLTRCRPEDVTDRHLLLYNGIIDHIPGLESELDDISSKKPSQW